jgi:predicted nucleotidyltransferase
MGRNQVHELNRDHVAAEAAILLADLRLGLWERFRSELGSWKVKPLYAAVFGSATRGDGDQRSDIDLLLVRPNRAVAMDRWEVQLDSLRELVQRWTGNHLQIIDLSEREWRSPAPAHRPLLRRVHEEGLELARNGRE